VHNVAIDQTQTLARPGTYHNIQTRAIRPASPELIGLIPALFERATPLAGDPLPVTVAAPTAVPVAEPAAFERVVAFAPAAALADGLATVPSDEVPWGTGFLTSTQAASYFPV
jgi:hypothetical protein